jgi:SNF2 family DNA or RNA helicase
MYFYVLLTKQRKRKIIITSYDLATHHVDNLKDFQIAIADEAHNLKSGTSKRSLALVPFLK